MKRKIISSSLILLMLVQSCVVYEKYPRGLKDSYNSGPVRVITDYDETINLSNIIFENGEFYGIRANDGVKIRIDSATSANLKFYLKDVRKSKTNTQFLIGGIVLSFVAVIVIGTVIATTMAANQLLVAIVTIGI
jgi:hypothetical protein